MQTKIEADDLGVVIDGRPVLEGISLRCRAGQITSLAGPSGSGKTTLLHCLSLLQRPSSGRLRIDGEDVGTWSARRRSRFWRESATFVLQDYGIVEEESVAFNVVMRASPFGGRVSGDGARLREVLSTVGLAGREDEVAAHLSGGEKQRLAIARAVYRRAELVFVDEPTASLDAANRRRVIALLEGLALAGRTVVVSTHDDDILLASDVVLRLDGIEVSAA